MKAQRIPIFLLAVVISLGGLLVPAPAQAKVFFYVLSIDGALVKYDPDTDQIISVKTDAGQGFIDSRLEDNWGPVQRQVLDMQRQQVITGSFNIPDMLLLDLQAKAATRFLVGPVPTILEMRQVVYPRTASRFYVEWLQWDPTKPEQPAALTLTAVGHDGKVIGTFPDPFFGEPPIYQADGHHFFVGFPPRGCQSIDGETLAVEATFDFTSLTRPGFAGPGLGDVRGNRALLGDRPTSGGGPLGPLTLFTTDLSFNPQSASPRIATGLSAAIAYLVPGATQVVVQEPLANPSPTSIFEGGGALHFYDIANGTTLGTVTFPAPGGAEILGFHPDGHRLFLRATPQSATADDLPVFTRLVIIDVVTRTVVRDRPLANMGKAFDFVDEP